MTPPAADFEDILRRALRAAAEPVEPAGDGLDKIQRRLAEPWLKREAWRLRHAARNAGWLLRVRAEELSGRAGPALVRVRAWAPAASGQWRARLPRLAGRAKAGDRRRTPAHAGRSSITSWLGPGVAGLRSAIAVAGAVALVAVGVYALGQLHQAVLPATQSSGSSPLPAPGGPSTSARRHPPPTGRPGAESPPTTSRRRHHRPSPAPTCSESAQQSPQPDATGITAPSPGPTSSASVSLSPAPAGVAGNPHAGAVSPYPGGGRPAGRSCAPTGAAHPPTSQPS